MALVEELPLHEYFEQYGNYNLDIINGLKGPCRAHDAIPFYHEQGRDGPEQHHRKRNAIYFMVSYFTCD